MVEGGADNTGQVPSPDTPSLLRFLDFVYAVVFTGFVRNLYEEIIYAHVDDGAAVKAARFSFSTVIFFFVATDWIHARVLTDKEHYRNYTRFWVDLIIAFLAYGALRGATQAATSTTLYVLFMFLAGAAWAGITLFQGDACQYRKKFRLLFLTHLAGSLGLAVFWWWYVYGEATTLTPKLMWQFTVLLAATFLFEEALHVRFLPKEQWLGPSALPLPRGIIYKIVEWVRSIWHRVMRDPLS